MCRDPCKTSADCSWATAPASDTGSYCGSEASASAGIAPVGHCYFGCTADSYCPHTTAETCNTDDGFCVFNSCTDENVKDSCGAGMFCIDFQCALCDDSVEATKCSLPQECNSTSGACES